MSNTPEYIQSELPAIKLFQKMGYQYINGATQDERTDITETILKDRLLAAIKRINPWINDNNLNKAYGLITSVTGTSLMEINEKIWHLIRGGAQTVKQVIDGKEDFHPIHFIDYKNPDNNDYLIVNQIRYHGRYQNSIPDLVVYINGLPIAIIECKSPIATNAWDTAYNDIKYYQENSEKLFHFNQFCLGIWKDGGRYGAIGAPQQFYFLYRPGKDEDLSFLGDSPSKQDVLLYALFRKERILDLIRHFILFEMEEGRTIKKLPRHQQLRATNKTIKRLQGDEGGVVWHTQGSGKSLTMAYIARKLQAPEYGFNNPTILVMTDRKDLDRQITTTLQHVGFKNVKQASSVAHLQKLLGNDYGSIITTTIQKFQESDRESTSQEDQTEIEEKGNIQIEKKILDNKLIKITKELQEGKWIEIERTEIDLAALSNKENLYVMVDEAHRSHYGFLAAFMRSVLPNAKFIAFTGTPISKEDKSTLGEFYGGDYIDVYTIKESVADGATVELLYDEGIAKLDIKKEELDKEFEEKFKDESEEKKDLLKRKALQKYQLSKERIRDISKHIVDHYRDKIYPDKHKAMIVCSGRPAAIKYQEALLKLKEQGYHNFDSKVVISMGSPKGDAIAKEYFKTLEWNKNNPNDQKPILVVPPEMVKTVTDDFKLPFGDERERDKSGKKKKYDNTAFIIVSDMLLTGWDAPIASCLYLDKPLKEHNLLQAIARVNRSRQGKNAGFIIDYNGITDYLIQALEIFSGDLRPDDILKNINEELPILELNHNKLVEFFKPLKVDRKYDREKYIDKALLYIEPLDRRDEFKTLLKDFNKSINLILPNQAALKYEDDFKLYNELKLRAKNAYPDDDGLRISPDESKMLQDMIDAHLKSEGVESLLNEPISIIDKEKFKEEIMNASPATKELKMRNNLKHTIKVGIDKNPDFYKPLAQRLEELLKQYEEKRLTQLQLLLAYSQIQDEIISQQKEGEEKGFNTERSRAVFNSMKTIFNNEAEDATRSLFALIKGELDIIDWQNKGRVKKDIENKIKRLLQAKLESSEAKIKAREMVDVLIKNKG
ncbi:type I restriction endonuclease subunit R [Aequorivita antarctica]|uniref:type I site-specific deoxyribonuclease n=1 Tax=Aequorivita antarctica TaxID=153266 RepID=A0A5C6Z1P4_9FLAO|nr:type I restriction endonuclease subunit R [Aequorivita antarctica]TXD73907.1 type I restriction endonuclease subunit R [Aequorivita antarctica]SRX73374.1 Type I restriction enzyme EcoR124II R protein [Aequorivita antarctica]